MGANLEFAFDKLTYILGPYAAVQKHLVCVLPPGRGQGECEGRHGNLLSQQPLTWPRP